MDAVAHAAPGARRTGHRAGASVLALSGVLAFVAGVLELLAAAIRWAPCVDDVRSAACVRVEDHAFDYVFVSEPFVLTPLAVPLAGVATLLLVALWSIVAAATWADGWARTLAAVLVVSLAVVGGAQLLASVSEGRVGLLPTWLVGVLFWVLLFAQTVAAARLALRSAPSFLEKAAWIGIAAAAAVGNVVSDLVLLNPFSGSHDTPVGGGMPHAVLTALGGLLLLAAALVAGQRTRDRSGRPIGDM